MSAQAVLEQIADDLSSFECDPLGFVMWAFPWGEEGTPLEHETGPDEWQLQELREIGASLKGEPHKPIRRLTTSGHGIGKTAEVAWLSLWAAMTMPGARGVVTANSDTQLRTKTWAELAKWHALLIPPLREQFSLTATALYHRQHEKTWRIDAVPNSKTNPAAFAGLHNAGRRVFLVFDEGSEIPDIIYETADGALTDKDTQLIWLVYGNPTKNTGRFKENAEGRFRHKWRSSQIDSRSVKRTNKAELAEWVEAWGEDSDFVRVRVRGVFPRVGTAQLISSELVAEARRRGCDYDSRAVMVAGLDVARFGEDQSVLQARIGRDARSVPTMRWRGADTMHLASEVARWVQENPRLEALFVDAGGVGAGVYDRLVQLRVPKLCKVFPVNFASKGGDTYMNGVQIRAANMRARMWLEMREWLALGCIPDDGHLEADLCGVEYGYRGADGAEILLESKDHMRSRGLASPDWGDALALTFAYPIAPKGIDPVMASARARTLPSGSDYDLYADLRD